MSHWHNTSFGIAYFIAGKAHTPDGAYKELCGLKEDRIVALKTAEAGYKKQQAKIIRANKVINDTNSDDADVLEAEADILELKAIEEQQRLCCEAAVMELDFIQACIDKIQPFRKYSHLSDEIAHQACLHEEWKWELIERAKNYLLTSGTIPADHYGTMRLHPDFKTDIEPVIRDIQYLQQSGSVNLGNASGAFDLLPETTKRPMDKLILDKVKFDNLLTSGEKE